MALLDIRADSLDKAVAEVASLGARAIGIETDVARRDSVEAAAERIDREFGRIHIVMNNAGVVVRGIPMHETMTRLGTGCSASTCSVPSMARKFFVPRMRAHDEGGHIVNTASLAGF